MEAEHYNCRNLAAIVEQMHETRMRLQSGISERELEEMRRRLVRELTRLHEADASWAGAAVCQEPCTGRGSKTLENG